MIGFHLDNRTATAGKQQSDADQVGRHLMHASIQKGTREALSHRSIRIGETW
jgi:hypothetical protein